jgi:hypothetical protein
MIAAGECADRGLSGLVAGAVAVPGSALCLPDGSPAEATAGAARIRRGHPGRRKGDTAMSKTKLTLVMPSEELVIAAKQKALTERVSLSEAVATLLQSWLAADDTAQAVAASPAIATPCAVNIPHDAGQCNGEHLSLSDT